MATDWSPSLLASGPAVFGSRNEISLLPVSALVSKEREVSCSWKRMHIGTSFRLRQKRLKFKTLPKSEGPFTWRENEEKKSKTISRYNNGMESTLLQNLFQELKPVFSVLSSSLTEMPSNLVSPISSRMISPISLFS